MRCAKVLRQGEAWNYTEAHLVARWCLGLLHDAPVPCRHCGVPDTETRFHAALDWASASADRLRSDRWGRVFSCRPDLDYIALCIPCHVRYDRTGWRRSRAAQAAFVFQGLVRLHSRQWRSPLGEM